MTNEEKRLADIYNVYPVVIEYVNKVTKQTGKMKIAAASIGTQLDNKKALYIFNVNNKDDKNIMISYKVQCN